MAPDQYKFQMASADFQSARQKAAVQEILARITGRSTQLLSYENVAEKWKLRGVQRRCQANSDRCNRECWPL
jgi:hypothetical protein